VPHLRYTAFSGAVVTDRATVQPIKRAHTDFDLCCHTATRIALSLVCRLNGFYLCNPRKYIDYYSFNDPSMDGRLSSGNYIYPSHRKVFIKL